MTAAADPPRPPALDLLVLGGTRFAGRAIVDAALSRGHRVTLFNRGRTGPGLFDDRVERLRGDRDGDLSALAGRSWDAVVDVAAYTTATVRRSLDVLAPAVGRYLFVSTVSVYADHSVPPVEGAAVERLEDPDDTSPETYGARKAACETLVNEAMGDTATVVRPGLIVGPHDPTDRFAYWPRRIAAGGRVLGPGDPDDPLQFIDVRDLASFVVHLLESGRAGTFNATGPTIRFGELIEACASVTGERAEVVWVSSAQLIAAGADPWMGVPLWLGDPSAAAANRIVIDRALAAGLVVRPLVDTVAAALEHPGDGPRSEFTREAEAAFLAAVADRRPGSAG